MDQLQTDQYGHVHVVSAQPPSSSLRIFRKLSFGLIRTESQASIIMLLIIIAGLTFVIINLSQSVSTTQVEQVTSPPTLEPQN